MWSSGAKGVSSATAVPRRKAVKGRETTAQCHGESGDWVSWNLGTRWRKQKHPWNHTWREGLSGSMVLKGSSTSGKGRLSCSTRCLSSGDWGWARTRWRELDGIPVQVGGRRPAARLQRRRPWRGRGLPPGGGRRLAGRWNLLRPRRRVLAGRWNLLRPRRLFVLAEQRSRSLPRGRRVSLRGEPLRGRRPAAGGAGGWRGRPGGQRLDGRTRVSLQLQQGLPIGTAAVGRGSPGACAAA